MTSLVGKRSAGLKYWPDNSEFSHKLFIEEIKKHVRTKLFRDKTCVLEDLPTMRLSAALR